MLDASLPPFPDDVPTVPLLVVDYALIKQRDQLETDRLWKAATELGFWYLKNHGAGEETDGMFAMGAETMDLPLEEKMKFEQGDSGVSFGYKAKCTVATDANGSKDGVEFMVSDRFRSPNLRSNVAKDDTLSWPKVTHRTYPSTVEARMKSTITPFVRKSVEINTTLIDVFNDKLGLPKGTLVEKHTLYDPSGSEARCIKSPASDDLPQDNPSIGAHTDFGSLSFLHHRTIGGLQVQPPGTQGWKYVKCHGSLHFSLRLQTSYTRRVTAHDFPLHHMLQRRHCPDFRAGFRILIYDITAPDLRPPPHDSFPIVPPARTTIASHRTIIPTCI